MYGRPFARRKRAQFYAVITCVFCGKSINWYQDFTFTLHHLRGEFGSPFGPVARSHRRCYLRAAARTTNETRRQRYGPILTQAEEGLGRRDLDDEPR